MPASTPQQLFPILYRTVAGTAPGDTKVGRVARVTSSGMTAACRDDLPEGTSLELRFTLPDSVLEVYADRPLTSPLRRPFGEIVLRARILYRQAAADGINNYGLTFLDVDLTAREQIARYEHALAERRRH